MPQFGINSGDAENWRGIDFRVDKHQRMICCHIAYNNITSILAAKYGMHISKIARKTYEYVRALKHNIRLISHARILTCHFFLVYATAIFVVYPVVR